MSFPGSPPREDVGEGAGRGLVVRRKGRVGGPGLVLVGTPAHAQVGCGWMDSDVALPAWSAGCYASDRAGGVPHAGYDQRRTRRHDGGLVGTRPEMLL